MNILAEVGKQRMLGQKVVSLFYQAAKGLLVSASKTDTGTALAEGTVAMQTCIEGSTYLVIPSPPSQQIVDALITATGSWGKFSGRVSKDLQQSDLVNNVDLGKITYYADQCRHQMNHVAALYVNASLAADSQLRSVLVEISWRQMILLQQISKEALLVSLGESPESSALAFALSVRTFEASHTELLVGRVAQTGQGAASNGTSGVTVLFPDRSLPATTDACTLTLMMTVLAHFDKLKGHLQTVVAGGMEAEVELSELSEAAATRKTTLAAMRSAVTSYSSGETTCNTVLTSAEWESGLQLAGKSSELLQKAMKDFALIAAGAASSWMQAAQTALDSHQGYISDDVESPVLAEAVGAFKEG